MHFDLANVYIESTRNLTSALSCANESITKFIAALQPEIDRANRRQERTQALKESTDRRQRARGYRRDFAPTMDLVIAAKKWNGARDAV